MDNANSFLNPVNEVLCGSRAPFEDQEGSELSDSDLSDDEHGSGSVGGEPAERKEPAEQEIPSRLADLDEILGRLFKLTNKIRSPASRLGGSKALTYTEIDPETKVDLLHQLMQADFEHIRELIKQVRISRDSPLRDVVPTGLIQKLAKANFRRRQQLRYWRSHQAKLKRYEVHTETDDPSRPLPPLSESTHLATANDEEGGSQRTPKTQISTPTSATALDETTVNLSEQLSTASDFSTTTSIASLSTEGADGSQDAVDLPPPPRHLLNGAHFECPLCFTILKRRFLEPRIWRQVCVVFEP